MDSFDFTSESTYSSQPPKTKHRNTHTQPGHVHKIKLKMCPSARDRKHRKLNALFLRHLLRTLDKRT